MKAYLKMEMPKNCNDCPLCKFEGAGYVSCRILHAIEDGEELKPWKRKRKDCPLIPVPPHGRLIDADALLNLLNNCMFPSDMVTTSAVRMATNWIKDAPTVVEAEEGE